jgi:hypothetical protein
MLFKSLSGKSQLTAIRKRVQLKRISFYGWVRYPAKRENQDKSPYIRYRICNST